MFRAQFHSLSITIFLLVRREYHIKRPNLVAKSPMTREKPAENSKQLLCGFFYKDSKLLLRASNESWLKMGKEVLDLRT